ncbi:FUSC family protein [Fulvimonas sp. R45]|uniref:FUSC family protein n=1 Tax=Fulvimonas sp. R45 TaxID=3045937 RepID=UPI00265E6F06|nr:FUSC family protein [Fulvimonas sp. R45]MDO1530602.1 FUSC family protein [Fulvimonas sp. R45]
MAFAFPDPARGPAAAWRALPEAVVALAAALLTLACAQWMAPGPGSAVLAVVLSLSLARSRLDRDRRGRLEAAVALPVVGLAATGVGLLLRDAPWLGAAAFTLGVSASVWLRQFGESARRASRLIALPFVTVLTVPHLSGVHRGPLPAILVPVLVALLALAWVSALDALGRRLRLLPGILPPAPHAPAAPARATPGQQRLSATTRMALQMAAALACAFAVGHAGFGRHWPWVVLTAFIVHSGNRGRLEVAYKSLLRLAGAAGGTLAAAVLSLWSLPAGMHGGSSATMILLAVFLGTWLRPLNYAWWALFVTVALALLENYAGVPATAEMALRLAAILAGAAIGVAVAWVVLPVRSTGVLRRRLADALAALGEALDPAHASRSAAPFTHALDAAKSLAPAFRAARTLGLRPAWRQPADWIDALAACRAPAAALIDRGATPGSVRRAVGAARQALREPDRLLPALEGLRGALEAAGEPATQGVRESG